MEEKNRIKTLLNDMDKEFQGLDHLHKAKFAIEQISMWQRKFNEAKVRIPREYIVDVTSSGMILSQYPEFEAEA